MDKRESRCNALRGFRGVETNLERPPRPLAIRLAILIALLTCSAFSQQRTFTLDPVRSTVHYTVSGNFHTVHGTFRFKSGSISFDPATGAASGKLIVDPSSGESGSEGRDSRMKRAILETDKYPEVVLTIDGIEGPIAPSGESAVKLRASMTLHGEAHPMVIPAQLSLNGEGASGTAEVVIPYVAWGLKNPSTFILRVSDKVTLEISAIGRLSAPAASEGPRQ